MSGRTKIAFFGGSFDPVHLGHVRLAREIRAAEDLDEVRFLLSATPPHKHGVEATFSDRLRMLELALTGEDGLVPDDREGRMPEPSYTIATMEAVAREAPDADLFFVIGMDSLRDLPSWHRAEDLVALVTFLVAARPGDDRPRAEDAARGLPGLEFRVVETTPVDVASREIRAGIRAGATAEGALAPAVARYIEARRLYR